jgi:hypothetical protein
MNVHDNENKWINTIETYHQSWSIKLAANALIFSEYLKILAFEMLKI